MRKENHHSSPECTTSKETDNRSEPKNLAHMIYASRESTPFSESDLIKLLAKARSVNQSLGVTGMLLYSDESFLQILEGEKQIVERLYEKIARDNRHTQVTRIISESIPARAFGDWSMGYASADPRELQEIDGLNDFFGEARCLVDLDSGRAKKILRAFAMGRWRKAS